MSGPPAARWSSTTVVGPKPTGVVTVVAVAACRSAPAPAVYADARATAMTPITSARPQVPGANRIRLEGARAGVWSLGWPLTLLLSVGRPVVERAASVVALPIDETRLNAISCRQVNSRPRAASFSALLGL